MEYFCSEGEPRSEEDAPLLVVPLSALDRTMLAIGGGKAANLGELIRAGFAVPPGFCITTAAYARVCAHAGLDAALSMRATTTYKDTAPLTEQAASIRTTLLTSPLPSEIAEHVAAAYRELGHGEPLPVAVRSSATAEDLPAASFAGQQETSLNIIGIEPLRSAIQRCFASLWTDRAVSYRARQGIDARSVRMAIVVQQMVEAKTAGVLFTANPLSGKRREAMIDATPGLGEAVVSGATNPDHFRVKTTTGEILERSLAAKRVLIQATAGGGTQRIEVATHPALPCLSDTEIRCLVQLGDSVEAHYGMPQDIEWAIDASGKMFLLQARPITTLFPLPAGAPPTEDLLRVYLSFSIQQGTYQPFTPMGMSTIRLLASVLLTLMGQAPSDPLVGPPFITEAASRPFFDVTTALRSAFGRRFLIQGMAQAEVHAQILFQQLAADPRLSLLPTPRLALLRGLILFLARSRIPWYLLQALVWPTAAEARIARFTQTLRTTQIEQSAQASASLGGVMLFVFDALPRLMRTATPAMLAGMLAYDFAGRLLGSLATESERQVVLQGSPCNPTTEMTLALWALAQEIRTDPETARLMQQTPASRLAEDYRAHRLPLHLQQGLSHVLGIYGHRSVNELDLGVPRWSEDPTYVLGLLASYQQMHDPTHTPEEQYRQAREEAQAMIATLVSRARRTNWVRGLLADFFLRRANLLAGMREMPRFCASLLLAQARKHIMRMGEQLVQIGLLAQAEDIFLLTLPEMRAVQTLSDLPTRIEMRRALYAREQGRRHVPLILLSDGTEPAFAQPRNEVAAGLRGTPASPGMVTARARVILDPHQAHLEPGEILVAPSTDPGWTPLFLKASGLVMEMGGAMAHGAIVAREYGLPAVVGVTGAIERITMGSRITVDGTTGTVIIEPSEKTGGSGI